MTDSNRLKWTDADWAKYLNCSVENIKEYKKILSKNIIMSIKALGPDYRMYEFQIWKLVVGPKGRKIKQPVFFDFWHQSLNRTEVADNANTIISSLKLKDEVAAKLNVPKAAVQMMLIREK